MIEQEIAQFEKYYDLIRDYLLNYSMQLLGAVVILIIGLWLSKKLADTTRRLMLKHNIDVTLTNFVANVVKVLVVGMFIIIALGKVGISVTPFVAAIGAASLGAGLAVQGMLSNYGAGLALIATRPFVVGDTISVKNVSGQVKSIELGYTILVNEQKVEITVPNKHIIGEVLHNSFNFSHIEGEIGIAYDAPADKAIEIIRSILQNEEYVANDPLPQVGIESFSDSAIVISYRYWTPTTELIENKLNINMAIYTGIKNAQIEIPFPQRVVTIKSDQRTPR
ncbi:mechanosensitive ion channel family protein [Pseudoalteromonas luteoviolacea]|uniref:Small-conductance mechanosensitive channel n=1 Tax=Pseudoalteromonas luteoviolacea S4060-1 TaxID=1365257 RepID=A0A167MVE7_9GAMM|nr:mechanosensitive ion channel domain-containing protein [Pseudoalteromonas luteoviolacea]KZN67007.1 mechanosensitive ion channel protein MscS [Pseudoalteromonas luteoviolacea S4060-1]